MASEFWAGYLSGAIGILVGTPLDVIKVRVQAGRHAHVTQRATGSASFSTAFKGLLNCLLCVH